MHIYIHTYMCYVCTHTKQKFLWNLHILNIAKNIWLGHGGTHLYSQPSGRWWVQVQPKQRSETSKCTHRGWKDGSVSKMLDVQAWHPSQILSTPVKCWFWYMPVLLPLGRWKERTLELTSHLVLLNWWVPGPVRDLISKERVERKEKSTCTSGLCVCPCTLDTKNILIGKLWWFLRDILSKHTGFPKHLGQITNIN